MVILDRIFGNKEEREYRALLAEVYNPLADRIDAFEEREVKDYFKVLLDASERSLRGILFMALDKLNFQKRVTKREIDFWLRKVSLAIMSYSYFFYADHAESERNPALAAYVDVSYAAYWQRMYDAYNQIFDESIGQKEIDYYAAGLREDEGKEYSKALLIEDNVDEYSEAFDKSARLDIRDYITIGSELLKEIWHEDLSKDELEEMRKYTLGCGASLSAKSKKVMFLGLRIWQAHQQIVQPFLARLLTDY